MEIKVKLYKGIYKLKDRFVLNERVKNKLSSLKKVFVKGTLIAITTTMLSGCGMSSKYSSNNLYNPNKVESVSSLYNEQSNNENNNEVATYANSESMSNNETTTQIVDYNFNYDQKVNFSEKNYQEYQDFSRNFNIEFDYEELYGIDEAAKLINKPQKKIENHNIKRNVIIDNKVDENALYQTVIENSKDFLDHGTHYMYSKIEDQDYIKEIIGYVVKSLNDDISEMTQEQKDELNCTLNDLKIFYGAGTVLAAVSVDNCLVVNPNIINMVKTMSTNEDVFKNTLYHEAKHLEQKYCNHHVNDEWKQIGLSKESDSLEVNSYKCLSLTEGSAEIGANNLSGNTPDSYVYLVGYINTLNEIAIMNPVAKGTKEVEKSSVLKDIKRFYNDFDVNNGITEYEFIKMLFGFDLFEENNKDFQKNYAKKYGVELTEEEDEQIQYNVRAQFCAMISKLFYNNLSIGIKNNKNVTLSDIFSLIKIHEADMNYHLNYSMEDRSDIAIFVDNYVQLQKAFFNQLSLSLGISYDELVTSFNNYKVFDNDNNLKASFNWLNDEKKTYLNERANCEKFKYCDSVMNYANNNSQVLSK